MTSLLRLTEPRSGLLATRLVRFVKTPFHFPRPF